MPADRSEDARRRARSPRALAGLVSGLTRQAFRRRGFSDGAVAADWQAIVGPLLAAHTRPERVQRMGEAGEGVLVLAVDGGALALELMHLEAQIVERVNAYFGFRAVDRLRVVQKPLPPQPAPPAPPRALTEPETAALNETLAGVGDPDLRAALADLGQAVARRREPDRGER